MPTLYLRTYGKIKWHPPIAAEKGQIDVDDKADRSPSFDGRHDGRMVEWEGYRGCAMEDASGVERLLGIIGPIPFRRLAIGTQTVDSFVECQPITGSLLRTGGRLAVKRFRGQKFVE